MWRPLYGRLWGGKMRPGRPDVFSAFGSFSGALDIAMLKEGAKYAPQMLPEMQAVFGMDLVLKEQDDLFALAQKAAALPKELRPRAYITCGSDDHGGLYHRTEPEVPGSPVRPAAGTAV